jgi:hypothetical protein
MKTNKNKQTISLPRSYDAGFTNAGKSIHKHVMHIKTPAGYFLRNDPGLIGKPYTPAQVFENLKIWERELSRFKPSLKGGAGYVLSGIRDVIARGIDC